MKYYVHDVPGRLRIRIPLLRSHGGRCERVRSLLEGVEGVTHVSVRCLTGSVVVAYDTDAVRSDRILGLLKENGYFDETRRMSQEEHIESVVGGAADRVGRAVFGWAVGRALESSGLAFLAVFI